jgi:uncharacterized tellurite resistance protein B-like protein
MFDALKHFMETLAGSPERTPQAANSVELSTAVLLVEVMRSDPQHDGPERQAIGALLRRRFALDDEHVRELLASAEERSRVANDYFSFTSLLNDHLAHEDKVAVIEFMWRVAYADGDADAGENHVISKVADLLHVTHGEYIAAKMHAKQDALSSG